MYRSRLAFALTMAALAAILVPSPLPAQITFQRTYGGADNDDGFSVQQTADGGYIIAGTTASFGAGGDDVYLIKTDAAGDTLWTRTFGGTADDYGNSVLQTADGGYAIAGYTYSFGAGSDDVWLIRTDGTGETLWTKTYGQVRADVGMSVAQTPDGGFVVAGFTSSFSPDAYADVWLVRTNSHGDVVWTRTYGGEGSDCGLSMQRTSDGGYVVVGYCTSFGAGDYDTYLVRTDANGDTAWTRSYGSADFEKGRSVKQTTDGGFVLVVYASHDTANTWLIKTDPGGDTAWTRRFRGAAHSVGQTADGCYIVAGSAPDESTFHADVWLGRTDPDGNALWTRTYGGAETDVGYSVQTTSDGGCIIAGYARSPNGNHDVYLIKTDSLGRVAVAEPKTRPTRASALSLTCEPNPFRTRTAISLQLTANSPAEVAIFDASGRRVRTFTVNRTPCTVWDGRDDRDQRLPSGTYFLRLDAGSQHATTRLVLQR